MAAKIFVPTVSSPAKIQRIREYGADLVGQRPLRGCPRGQRRVGPAIRRIARARLISSRPSSDKPPSGLSSPPRRRPSTPSLVAVGEGADRGIAAWCRAGSRSSCVEPHGAPTLTAARKAGRPVDAETGSIAADFPLAPRRVGELMFPIAQAHVHDVVLVSDAAIRSAQEALWSSLRIVAELGGRPLSPPSPKEAADPARDERDGRPHLAAATPRPRSTSAEPVDLLSGRSSSFWLRGPKSSSRTPPPLPPIELIVR